MDFNDYMFGETTKPENIEALKNASIFRIVFASIVAVVTFIIVTAVCLVMLCILGIPMLFLAPVALGEMATMPIRVPILAFYGEITRN